MIIGLPSSGIHSNGYSLVRKVFFDRMNMDVADYVEELGSTLGEALLAPTRIYVCPAKAVFKKYDVKATFFIMGGWVNYSEENKEKLQRICDEGHEIGNHSYIHPSFVNITTERMKEEIDKTALYHVLLI